MRLQVGIELARELPVLLGRKRQRPVRGVQLLGEGDVGVDDPPPHARDRLAIAQPARVHHRVDRERQRLKRREQQLGAAGELGLLGQRPEPEHRLMRAALRGVDDQAALLLEHRRVDVAHEVGPERLIGRVSVGGLDDQRRRLPVIVQHRLTETAARRAAKQPLQLTHRRPPRRQARLDAAERPLLRGDQGVDLGAGDRHRVRDPEDALDPPTCAIEPGRRALRWKRDRDVDLGRERAQLAQVRRVPLQVGPPRRRRLMARVEQAQRPLRVAVGRVGAADPIQREVGLDREREAGEPPQPLALVRGRQERIGDRVHAKQRGARIAVADEDVLVRVAQGEPSHGRTSSTTPGHSTTASPTWPSGTPRAWRPSSSTGTLNVTRAGPRTRPRRSCGLS